MNSDVKMVLGGVGVLIFAYLVIANAPNFAKVTDSIAGSSASVIGTLQGRGSGATNLNQQTGLNVVTT